MDLFLVPDPATLVTYVEPTGDGCRARFSCSVRKTRRSAASPAIRARCWSGTSPRRGPLDSTTESAIELEYYLFQPDNAGLLPPPDTAGYFGTGPGLGTGTRDDVVASLAEMGIQVGGAHHETGPGQEELDLLTADPLRMADTVLTVREVIRAVAQRHGLRANFMPKPLADARDRACISSSVCTISATGPMPCVAKARRSRSRRGTRSPGSWRTRGA